MSRGENKENTRSRKDHFKTPIRVCGFFHCWKPPSLGLAFKTEILFFFFFSICAAEASTRLKSWSLAWMAPSPLSLNCYLPDLLPSSNVSCSVVSNSSQPHGCQAPLTTEFSRQEYWSGVSFPSSGDLPNPGIEPGSPTLRADSSPSEPEGKPHFPPQALL